MAHRSHCRRSPKAPACVGAFGVSGQGRGLVGQGLVGQYGKFVPFARAFRADCCII